MKILSSWSIFKAPSPQRILTFSNMYRHKYVEKLDTRNLENVGIEVQDVKLWSERDQWLDRSKGIIYYLHSFRYNKGHIAFVKGLLKNRSLFKQFTVHFSGYRFKTKRPKKHGPRRKSISTKDIFLTPELFTIVNSPMRSIYATQMGVVVTWSDADANPRIPHDGLFG